MLASVHWVSRFLISQCALAKGIFMLASVHWESSFCLAIVNWLKLIFFKGQCKCEFGFVVVDFNLLEEWGEPELERIVTYKFSLSSSLSQPSIRLNIL